MCMFLLAHMSVHHVGAWCPPKIKECIGSLELGMVGSHHVSAGSEPQTSVRATSDLYC